MKDKLTAHFIKLIKNPTIPSALTKDLYEFLYTRSGFIAHFDRAGFHSARFCTLKDFDQTMRLIYNNKETKFLLINTINEAELGRARFKVAALEASVLHAQSKVMQYHIEQLQKQFTEQLIA